MLCMVHTSVCTCKFGFMSRGRGWGVWRQCWSIDCGGNLMIMWCLPAAPRLRSTVSPSSFTILPPSYTDLLGAPCVVDFKVLCYSIHVQVAGRCIPLLNTRASHFLSEYEQIQHFMTKFFMTIAQYASSHISGHNVHLYITMKFILE